MLQGAKTAAVYYSSATLFKISLSFNTDSAREDLIVPILRTGKPRPRLASGCLKISSSPHSELGNVTLFGETGLC